MTYFVAAFAASGIFIIAGWRSRQSANPPTASGRYTLPHDPLWGETETDLSAAQADAGAMVRLAVKRLAPVLASQSVHAEVAAPQGLMVRMRGAALADLLEDLLAAAIHGAPTSRILLTATARGDHVEIAVIDDMPNSDPAIRMARVRSLMERVAMRGGALDVDVRPAEGTTMTLRLGAAWTERADRRGAEQGPDTPTTTIPTTNLPAITLTP